MLRVAPPPAEEGEEGAEAISPPEDDGSFSRFCMIVREYIYKPFRFWAPRKGREVDPRKNPLWDLVALINVSYKTGFAPRFFSQSLTRPNSNLISAVFLFTC